jgi:hypothetical protein
LYYKYISKYVKPKPISCQNQKLTQQHNWKKNPPLAHATRSKFLHSTSAPRQQHPQSKIQSYTLAARGLEELFSSCDFFVSFWFWRETGFGFTYLCT